MTLTCLTISRTAIPIGQLSYSVVDRIGNQLTFANSFPPSKNKPGKISRSLEDGKFLNLYVSDSLSLFPFGNALKGSGPIIEIVRRKHKIYKFMWVSLLTVISSFFTQGKYLERGGYFCTVLIKFCSVQL